MTANLAACPLGVKAAPAENPCSTVISVMGPPHQLTKESRVGIPSRFIRKKLGFGDIKRVSQVTWVVAHTHKTEAGKGTRDCNEGPEGSGSTLGAEAGLDQDLGFLRLWKQQLADTPSSRTSSSLPPKANRSPHQIKGLG